MKKRKTGRTLSRDMDQRKALLRTLLVSLVENKSIKTTLAKAKELRPFVERQITHAKKGLGEESAKRMNSIRVLKKHFPQKTIDKLFGIAEILKDRSGGYLRIIRLGFRKSDSAEMAMIELVDKEKMIEKKEEKKKVKKKSEKKKDEEKR